MTAPPDDLASLYQGSYARLVAVVSAVCGSGDVAEEAVQEAFVRLFGRWSRVARYDDPEAWVRTVALRLASNRRRKLRNGVRAVARLGVPPNQPAPTADRVDVSRALAVLPRDQRAVLVLHYFCDLPVDRIAAELGISVGTVKSRMSRARAALAPALEEEDTRA